MEKILDFNDNNEVEILDLTATVIQIDCECNGKTDYLSLYDGEQGTIKIDDEVLLAEFNSYTLKMSRTSPKIEVVQISAVPVSKYFDINTNPYIQVNIVDNQIQVMTLDDLGVVGKTILADDINLLVTKINAEAQRRNKTGAIQARASSVVEGDYISKPNYDNIAAPLQEATSVTLPVVYSTILATGTGSYTYLSEICDVLEGYSDTASGGGCNSSCTGLCSSACSSGCTGTCTGGCQNTCRGTCRGNCGGNCSRDCNSDCWDQCTSSSAQSGAFTPGCGDCC